MSAVETIAYAFKLTSSRMIGPPSVLPIAKNQKPHVIGLSLSRHKIAATMMQIVAV